MIEFLKAELPSQGLYCAAQVNPKGGFFHRFFETVESLAHHIETQDAAGHTMYAAQASYKTSENRKTENALYVRNFFFDIDCGAAKFEQTPDKAYLTQKDGCAAVKEFAVLMKLPLPSVVNSGNGLYAKWLITDDIPADKWKVLATILKKVAQAGGFRQDPSRTSDTSSVLRPVGSTNRKGQPKPVTLLHRSAPISLATFVTALEAAAKKHKIDASVLALPTQFKGLNDEFTSGIEGPPSSLLVVAQRCAQVRKVRDSRGDVDEPTWYNFIGMARHTTEGKDVTIIHDWSKGHADYTPEATFAKIQQHVQGNYGPTTCEKFGSDNPGGCVACPYANAVKSPIVLGREAPVSIATEEEEKVAPEGFKRTDGGLQYEDNNAWHRFYPYDLFIENIAYDASLQYEIVTISHRMAFSGDYSNFAVRSSLIHDPKALLMVLADNHVQTTGADSRKQMVSYIDLAMAQMRANRKLASLHSQMGWREDGESKSFILGEKLFRKDEDIQTVGFAKNVPDAARAFKTEGSLAAWKATTKFLGLPGMEPFAFAFLAGAFGAPLIKFTGYAGALVALIGDSGIGKTLLGEWVMSVYGDSQKLILLKDDTRNFLVQRLGIYGTLPLYLDEISNIEGQELSDLVYKITQGRDKGRLSRNGGERSIINSWNTIAIASSNHSLQDKLSCLKADASPELNRIMEIEAGAVLEFDREAATGVYRVFRENYGVAGVEFVKYITDKQDQHRDKIDQIVRALDLSTNAKPEERFWSAVSGAAIYGGLIATHLGLIDFSVAKILTWAKAHILRAREEKKDAVINYSDMLGVYLDAHTRGTLVCSGNGPKEMVLPIKDPTAPLVCRINTDTHRLYISRSSLKLFLEKNYGSYSKLKTELEKIGALLDANKRKVLGGGTWFSGTQQPVWEIDLHCPGLGYRALGVVKSLTDKKAKGVM